ncbi:hypothetical protein POTOM_038406 [Populus tomentosa]|uniref:Metallo-beta-lactamase domain-containing protein n=1 Tax=Populus tomentosa TaxID=118781 RepID=A0A8X7YZ87_POPTO|nr:hypothetical protein POTOM_038406 [Populus tomentosa]
MAVKITADLRFPGVGLPSSPFNGQRRLNANSKGGKVSVIRAIQSQEKAAAAGPTPTRYQARRTRRPQNIEGDFFVDHTCIDCDTCRWIAPQVFTRIGEMSAVFKQPTSGEERLKALQALLSCPTSSIHTEKPASDILQAQKTFPTPIDQQRIPGVYHCGYHSEKSYGAASFLIVHPEGNIIIDSPRYTERLARNIEMLGGARYMFLTHEDDVADHRKWSEKLSCDRILHSGDVPHYCFAPLSDAPFIYMCDFKAYRQPCIFIFQVDNSTADVETKLQGSGPWNLGRDVQLIHTPGHTEGSVCLFYKPLKILFTGDHLLMTETGLSICERYNKCSVPMQIDSVLKLLEIDFNWIIPGHGRRVEFKDREEKDSILKAFVEENYSQCR